jgi:hypothetical protein
MSTNDARDDANLRHFGSRSQQPKLLGAQASAQPSAPVLNVYIAYDQPFSNFTDEMEATRFRYVGTSPQVSTFNSCGQRRLLHQSVSSFQS